MNDRAPLPSWNDGAAKTAIFEFVGSVTRPGSSFVAPADRIATFDADGTLWCEKPVPVELDFILHRLAQMATADPHLRDRQPWKAAYERDNAWLGQAITEHYSGDDAKVKVFLGGVGAAFAGVGVEDFVAQSGSFLRSARHPTLNRGYLETAYAPMVELLGYLESNGFTNYIVSGSGSDFMRSVALELFGIPPERVIGSEAALEYTSDDTGGTITNKGSVGFLDDGPQKPVQIWSRVGRRSLVAGGNSNGDIPMLDHARSQGSPTLRLLVNHDDAEREFAYSSGAEKALQKAATSGWTVVSMKNDFATMWRS
ncbi:MAG: HAD family hydrolase [Acidobacteriota bacterium]